MKIFPVPMCTITFDAVTGFYAFATRFEGKPDHDRLDTFTSVENVLAWVDPQGERIWEPASDADESKILVSRAYRPGSVPWRCQSLPARSVRLARSTSGGRAHRSTSPLRLKPVVRAHLGL
jgi:hypothetical protein